MGSEVAILIPHFNNPEGLEKSISSINENADIFIVDDGSSALFDEQQIRRIAKNENQIYYFYLDRNYGIEHALNFGINEIQKRNYKFIARLDCGDININERIRKHVNFLLSNPETYLVGSWGRFVDENGKFIFTVKPPSCHKEISRLMYLNCMFIHPTVMFRIEAVQHIGLYPTNYVAAEDYAYFFKFVKNFKTANYPEVLVHIEANPNGISTVRRKVQVYNRIRIILKYFYFGYYPIYGLFRNLALYLIPLGVLNILKKILLHEKN